MTVSAIAIAEDNPTQYPTTVIDTRHPVTLGEKGFKLRQLRVSQQVEVAHGSVSLRRLNHANNLKSMGLESS